MTSAPKYLFACGVGRSGTTALCEALNLHDKIVMGVERYKHLMMSSDGFPSNVQALYEKDRFFEYRPTDTNILIDTKEYAAIYDAARAKFDDAVYVGDKTPGLYKKLPELRANFPGCQVIYILRKPETVAFSWQNRANKGRANWPAANGYEACIKEWNRSLRIIEKHRVEWGDDLILLDYDTMFGPDAAALFAGLLDRLGLGKDINPALKEFLDGSIKAAAYDREIPHFIRDHVAENADYDLYNALRAPIV